MLSCWPGPAQWHADPCAHSCPALRPVLLRLQCHTNLVAVFAELEEQPDLLFSSTANLVAMVTGGASTAASPDKAAGGADREAETSEAGTAPAPAQEEEGRVLLLRNPPRRFVRPRGRTLKLAGITQVVCVASEANRAAAAPAAPASIQAAIHLMHCASSMPHLASNCVPSTPSC